MCVLATGFFFFFFASVTLICTVFHNYVDNVEIYKLSIAADHKHKRRLFGTFALAVGPCLILSEDGLLFFLHDDSWNAYYLIIVSQWGN